MKRLSLVLVALMITNSSFAFPSLEKEISCMRVLNKKIDFLFVQYVPYANILTVHITGGANEKFPGLYQTYVSGNENYINTVEKYNDDGKWNVTIESNKSDWNINFIIYNDGIPVFESNMKCQQIG